MKRSNISYPYPVLGIGDDVFPLLEDNNAPLNVDIDGQDYVFSMSIKLENKAICTNIANGYAEYVIEIDCSRTLYRVCVKQDNPDFCIRIPKKALVGEIRFTPSVIATQRFLYRNPGFNIDYGDNLVFEIERGDILAIFNESSYNVSINYDKLTAYDSFMHIHKSEDADDVRFEIDSDKIEVTMPVKEFEQYDTFGSSYENEILSSVVLNALTYSMLVNNWDDDSDERTWVTTIKYRLTTEEALQKFDINNPMDVPRIAQAILKNPYGRMFDMFVANINGGDDDND